jgi:hypothetical protein
MKLQFHDRLRKCVGLFILIPVALVTFSSCSVPFGFQNAIQSWLSSGVYFQLVDIQGILPPIYVSANNPILTQAQALNQQVKVANYDQCFQINTSHGIASGASVSTPPSGALVPQTGTCAPGFTPAVGSKIYYVTSQGSNSNSGLSLSQSFATISQAASLMIAGDTCIVRAGTYRETVTPAHSGTSAAAIRFIAAPFENVVVSGADLITGWSSSGSFYQAPISFSTNQVFVNSQMVNLAQYPNAGLNPMVRPVSLQVTAGATATTQAGCSSNGCYVVSSPSLTQTANTFAGASLWFNNYGLAQTGTVVSSTQGDGTSTNPGLLYVEVNSASASWAAGTGYVVLSNLLSLLDDPYEWYSTGSALYLGSHQASDVVEAKRRVNAFDFTGLSYIQIKGFQIFAASANLYTANNSVIDSCSFKYVIQMTNIVQGWNHNRNQSLTNDVEGLGIQIGGSYNVMKNSRVAFSAGDGITVTGTNNTVQNCVVHDVNYIANDSALIQVGSEQSLNSGHLITNNTLYNAGRSGLLHRHLGGGTLTMNHVYNVGLSSQDLGLTYTFQTDASHSVISYNWLHNNFAHNSRGQGEDVGIYVDNDTTDYLTIHHNVVWGTCGAPSLQINTPSTYINVYNNTTWPTSLNQCTNLGGIQEAQLPNYNISITNNLSNAAIWTQSGDAVLTTNLTASVNSAASYFVDALNHNFQLASASLAIGVGTILSGITTTPNAAAPAAGAYELGNNSWVPGSTNLDGTYLPVVSLLNPVDEINYATDNMPLLNAEAMEANGTIAKVQFFADGNLIGSGVFIAGQMGTTIATHIPSHWSLQMTASMVSQNTWHVITATATDASGVSSSSNSVRAFFGNRDSHQFIYAEKYDTLNNTWLSGEGSTIYLAGNGSWLEYDDVNFYGSMTTAALSLNVDSAGDAGDRIEVHLDSPTGTLIASLTYASTCVSNGSGGCNYNVVSQSTPLLTVPTGIHNLYIVRVGSGGLDYDSIIFQ